MSTESTNEGIWIGGGATVNAGAMAAGPMAVAQGNYPCGWAAGRAAAVDLSMRITADIF